MLVPIVQRLHNFTHWINHYPAVKLYWLKCMVIRWIVLYPLDNVVQPLNNWCLIIC